MGTSMPRMTPSSDAHGEEAERETLIHPQHVREAAVWPAENGLFAAMPSQPKRADDTDRPQIAVAWSCGQPRLR